MKQRIYLILGLLVFGFLGCQKDSLTKEELILETEIQVQISDVLIRKYIQSEFYLTDFFNLKQNPTIEVGSKLESREYESLEEIKIEIARQDLKWGFVKKIYEELGIPEWDQALKLDLDPKTKIYYVGLKKKDSKQISAIIAAVKINNFYHLDIISRSEMDNFISNKSLQTKRTNLAPLVLSMIGLEQNQSINGKASKKYVQWLLENKNNLLGLESRACYTYNNCTVVNTNIALFELESRDYQVTCVPGQYCDSPTSGPCQLCGTGTGSTGSTGGGSGGTGGTTTVLTQTQQVNLELLEIYLELTPIQIYDLRTRPSIIDQMYYAYTSSSNSIAKANGIYDVLINTWGLSKYIEVAHEIAYLKLSSPGKSESWYVINGMWNVFNGIIHSALDLAGLVPAVGEVADLANAGIYVLQGDKASASFSILSAVPFTGWISTTGRFGAKVLRRADGVKEIFEYRNINGKIDFGDPGQLRRVLQIPTGSSNIAHHIIPTSLMLEDVVQNASKSGRFHMNALFNGIPLSSTLHGTGFDTAHRVYNDKLRIHLQKFATITPSAAAQELLNLTNSIRTQLNQGKKLDQITF